MSRTSKSDFSAYCRELIAAGLVIERRRTGHLRVTLPDGKFVGTVPTSPSDPHWLQNNRAYLRKRLAALAEPPTRRTP
jgi:hypothetical protein